MIGEELTEYATGTEAPDFYRLVRRQCVFRLLSCIAFLGAVVLMITLSWLKTPFTSFSLLGEFKEDLSSLRANFELLKMERNPLGIIYAVASILTGNQILPLIAFLPLVLSALSSLIEGIVAICRLANLEGYAEKQYDKLAERIDKRKKLRIGFSSKPSAPLFGAALALYLLAYLLPYFRSFAGFSFGDIPLIAGGYFNLICGVSLWSIPVFVLLVPGLIFSAVRYVARFTAISYVIEDTYGEEEYLGDRPRRKKQSAWSVVYHLLSLGSAAIFLLCSCFQAAGRELSLYSLLSGKWSFVLSGGQALMSFAGNLVALCLFVIALILLIKDAFGSFAQLIKPTAHTALEYYHALRAIELQKARPCLNFASFILLLLSYLAYTLFYFYPVPLFEGVSVYFVLAWFLFAAAFGLRLYAGSISKSVYRRLLTGAAPPQQTPLKQPDDPMIIFDPKSQKFVFAPKKRRRA